MLPAISSVARDLWALWKVDSPTCSVMCSWLLIATSGHRKSFHVHSSVISASVESAGPDSGSTILTSTPSRLQPSIRAASSSSIGSVRKNWRSMKMPNAVARFGSISAVMLSITPRWRTIRKVGIRITWNGTISVARSSKNSTFEPKNSQPGERVGGQAADHQVREHDHRRDDHRVQVPGAERRRRHRSRCSYASRSPWGSASAGNWRDSSGVWIEVIGHPQTAASASAARTGSRTRGGG